MLDERSRHRSDWPALARIAAEMPGQKAKTRPERKKRPETEVAVRPNMVESHANKRLRKCLAGPGPREIGGANFSNPRVICVYVTQTPEQIWSH
jgi:hypothetical protein